VKPAINKDTGKLGASAKKSSASSVQCEVKSIGWPVDLLHLAQHPQMLIAMVTNVDPLPKLVRMLQQAIDG
jgi:hypothetical protein